MKDVYEIRSTNYSENSLYNITIVKLVNVNINKFLKKRQSKSKCQFLKCLFVSIWHMTYTLLISIWQLKHQSAGFLILNSYKCQSDMSYLLSIFIKLATTYLTASFKTTRIKKCTLLSTLRFKSVNNKKKYSKICKNVAIIPNIHLNLCYSHYHFTLVFSKWQFLWLSFHLSPSFRFLTYSYRTKQKRLIKRTIHFPLNNAKLSQTGVFLDIKWLQRKLIF